MCPHCFSLVKFVDNVLPNRSHISSREGAVSIQPALCFRACVRLLVNLLLVVVLVLVNFYFQLALVILLFYFFDFVQQHVPAAATRVQSLLTLAARLLRPALLQRTATHSSRQPRTRTPHDASHPSTFCSN